MWVLEPRSEALPQRGWSRLHCRTYHVESPVAEFRVLAHSRIYYFDAFSRIVENHQFGQGIEMRIAVIGAGYVGLVTGTCLAQIGHEVVCTDNDESKIASLQAHVVPI